MTFKLLAVRCGINEAELRNMARACGITEPMSLDDAVLLGCVHLVRTFGYETLTAVNICNAFSKELRSRQDLILTIQDNQWALILGGDRAYEISSSRMIDVSEVPMPPMFFTGLNVAPLYQSIAAMTQDRDEPAAGGQSD